jgi:hypothetical protein
MTRWLSCAAVAVLCLAPPLRAEEPAKKTSKSFEVPYRLTVPKHILVRAKVNGKGPYNFILDTGAPALFIAKDLGKKLGLTPDRRGWETVERFEIEGGVVLRNARARVETPFQLEGMNGMGLAGAELHGIIGYDVLARYRLEIDFTRDKMVWTLLDYEPRAPLGLGGRSAGGGLEVFGSILKVLGGMLGMKAAPDAVARGFLGLELGDGDENPVVRSVLPQGPAGRAGVRPGDVLTHFQGRTVLNTEDVERFARRLTPGTAVKLTVVRGKETKEIRFKTGEGL